MNSIFIKNIGPLVVVGYVPVLTLWLNPSIPPLVGGRVSAHIFSMVLVMVKYNTNLGLGILTSMIWIDAFYLCLFCMIALGLFGDYDFVQEHPTPQLEHGSA